MRQTVPNGENFVSPRYARFYLAFTSQMLKGSRKLHLPDKILQKAKKSQCKNVMKKDFERCTKTK